MPLNHRDLLWHLNLRSGQERTKSSWNVSPALFICLCSTSSTFTLNGEGPNRFWGTRDLAFFLGAGCGKLRRKGSRMRDEPSTGRASESFLPAGYGNSSVEWRDAGRFASLKPSVLAECVRKCREMVFQASYARLFPGKHALHDKWLNSLPETTWAPVYHIRSVVFVRINRPLVAVNWRYETNEVVVFPMRLVVPPRGNPGARMYYSRARHGQHRSAAGRYWTGNWPFHKVLLRRKAFELRIKGLIQGIWNQNGHQKSHLPSTVTVIFVQRTLHRKTARGLGE